MRLLFISNLYPPGHLGGYELLCQEVAARLGERGHAVTVLTSTFRADGLQEEPGVLRRLLLESDVYYYKPLEVLPRYLPVQNHNRKTIAEVMAATRPEAVVVWGMWKLSPAVATLLEHIAGDRLVYYLANEWPIDAGAHEAYWDGPCQSIWGKGFKTALRPFVRTALRREWRPYHLELRHAIACSASVGNHLLEAGVLRRPARVIYHGIDTESYAAASARQAVRAPEAGLKVAFVGSLLPHKGVHTAVEALGRLAVREMGCNIKLDILGAGHPDYEAQLHRTVAENDLGQRVRFHAPIPRSELPDFLAGYDVLVLPSIWPEPLARISQEAMAAGLVLVGTMTGGTSEILEPEVNGLAFTADDADDLANQLARLAGDPGLRARLARAGRTTVESRFTAGAMIDALEDYLSSVAQPQLRKQHGGHALAEGR